VFGHTEEKDDKHNKCELARAAACYAVADKDTPLIQHPTYIKIDPWPIAYHLPYRDRLVTAAALLVAEIERIDRKKSQ
jgi:hypothetical protein